MRTLLAIANPDLKNMFFSEKVLAKLLSITDYDWLEALVPGPHDSFALADIVGDYDAVLTSWGSPFFTEDVLAKAEKLKFIGHLAGSATAVVNEAAFAQGITVVTANNVLAKSTAEAAVALMLAGAWNLQGYSARMKRGGWSNNNSETVLGLSGRTIGIVGFGAISRNVISLLRGFPSKLKLVSRHCSEKEACELGVELCSLEELLSTSDIVSLHSSLTASTIGMIGEKELALIKDGALFVNTARAKIVDEDALMNALATGRFMAALDVFHQEPLSADHPLHMLDNVLAVPHIGGFNGNYKASFGDVVVDNLIAFLKGEKPEGRVMPEEFARMTANALV